MSLRFTDEQRSAINADIDRPLAIIACPGSGKTFTIIHRVAHLLQTKYHPSNLLIITFTRKAARELKERLNSLSVNTQGLTVLTFHSFGLSILRKFKHLLNMNEFRILTQAEQRYVLASITKGVNKNLLLSLQNYKAHGTCSRDLKPIFDQYNSILRKDNSCDFTDLLVLPLQILKFNPNTLHYYQRRYQYALVDEMQDVSKVQFELMKILFGDRSRLTVVGDDDQTIYGWRGADARLLSDFSNAFPNSQIIRLTQCFRCPQHIVKSMSSVINHNKIRVKKEIKSHLTNSYKINTITIIGAKNIADEASKVIASINNIRSGSIAILFRTRRAIVKIQSELHNRKFDAALTDHAKYLESKEVNFILNIMQMAAGIPYNATIVTSNELLLIRMYLSNEKYDEKINKKPIIKNQTNGPNFLDSDDDFDDSFFENHPELEQGYSKTVQTNNNNISDNDNDTDYISKIFNHLSPVECIQIISQALSLTSDNVSILLQEAMEIERNDTPFNMDDDSNDSVLSNFLYNIRLETERSEKSNPRIHLSTIHQAKGLEWDHVYIIGCTRGDWPSQMDTNSQEKLEEERRLFYVAMSRAKKELTISFIMNKGPSIFVREIPGQFVQFDLEEIDEKKEAAKKKEQNLKGLDLTFQKVSDITSGS